MKMTKESLLKVIGAADDVISALAGTNDEVHKDDTDKMVRMWDDLNDQYAPPDVVRELARMALAAMDSESGGLPLDYLQGHKDGLEWAAQLAEANHPETGDWFYDDPIELAKAIRKGPDMPPAQPVADSEPVAEVVSIYGDPEAFGEREIRPLVGIQQMPYGTKLYRHAQPAPVVPEEATPDSIEILASARRRDHAVFQWNEDQRNAAADSWNACRAAMLQAKSLTSINPAPAMVSLPKNAESMTGNSPVNDVTAGKPFTILLPDISSKAFWSGAGKNENFHPETYRRWVKEAIERYCAIARINVEVK